jgi:hypothetical protein
LLLTKVDLDTLDTLFETGTQYFRVF